MTGWRDKLKIHPAAELFPLMGKDELRALADDIEKHGIHEPITIWWNDELRCDELLDGRNRLDAIELLGQDPLQQYEAPKRRPSPRAFLDVDVEIEQAADPRRLINYRSLVTDPTAFIVSLNVLRRHLTLDQKRGVVAKLLKLEPEKSDRTIAAAAKVSHHTVASVRAKEEARGHIAHVEKRRDTRGREQPAKKAAPSVSAAIHEDLPPPPAAATREATPRNGHAEPEPPPKGNGHAEAESSQPTVDQRLEMATHRAHSAFRLANEANDIIQKIDLESLDRSDLERFGSLWTALLAAADAWQSVSSKLTARYPYPVRH